MASFWTDPKTGRTRVSIRRKGYKAISKYFDTERKAKDWAVQTEAAILKQQPLPVVADDMTVARLIAEYRRMRIKAGHPIDPASNSNYMLLHLEEDLGAERVADLTSDRFIAWATFRREQGAGGYTINMELSQLGTVVRHTASFLRITLPDVVGAARPMLHYLQLITGGNKRTRRATDDELERILKWLDEREPLVAEAVRVAAITGLRRGELARIVWSDLDPKGRAILVRKRKTPRRIEARDEWVPLLGEAWDVVQRLARDDERIFPVSKEKLTDSVTAATKALGIPNLHLHDLRRNATSTLREMGFDQHERKAITGHRSDEVHERYIAITPAQLHAKYAAAQGTPQRPKRPRKGRARPA